MELETHAFSVRSDLRGTKYGVARFDLTTFLHGYIELVIENSAKVVRERGSRRETRV
jgi:hypothetical protein